MEGGQKQNISLESELDIKTSDMMSNITQPKFAHNRQQYQGHYLPSSLRFEHDGWAAGWDVYNFKFTGEMLPTTPEGYYAAYTKISNNIYKLSICNKIDDDTYNEVGYILYCSKDVVPASITSVISNGLVYLLGKFNNKDFTIWFPVLDSSDSHIITSGNFQYSLVQKRDTSDYTVDIEDIDTLIEDGINLTTSSDMSFDVNKLKFISMQDNISVWEANSVKVEYDNNTNKCTASLGSYSDNIQYTVSNDKKLTGHFNKKYKYDTIIKLNTSTNISEYKLSKTNDSISMTKSGRDIDSIYTSFDRNVIRKDGITHLSLGVPVWKGLSIWHDGCTVSESQQKTSSVTIVGSTRYDKSYSITLNYTYDDFKYKIYPALWFNNFCYKSLYYDDGIEISASNESKMEFTNSSYGIYFSYILGANVTSAYVSDLHIDDAEVPLSDTSVSIMHSSTQSQPLNYLQYFDESSIPDYLKNMSITYTAQSGNIHFDGPYTYDNHGIAIVARANISANIYIDDYYTIKINNVDMSFEGHHFDYASLSCSALSVDTNNLTCKLSIIVQLNNNFVLFNSAVSRNNNSDSISYKTAHLPNCVYTGAVSQDTIGDDDSGMCVATSPFSYQQDVGIYCIFICNGATNSWNKPITYPHNFLQQSFNLALNSFRINVSESINNIQDIIVEWCNDTVHWTFNNLTGLLAYTGSATFTLDDINIAWSMEPVKTKEGVSKTDFNITNTFTLRYDIIAQLAFANGYVINSIANNKYYMKHIASTKEMYADITSRLLYIDDKKFNLEITANNTYYTLYRYIVDMLFNFTLAIPFSAYNLDILSFDDDNITFSLHDSIYSIDYNTLIHLNTGLEFSYINTNKESLDSHKMCEVDCNSEYMFLKQKWDTTSAIENYWWVDSKHILSLTKTHIILSRNTSVLDDWNGDIFEDIEEWPRDSILQYLADGTLNMCIKYGCTCAYNGDTSLFYSVHVFNGLLSIVFFNPITNDINQVDLEYNHVDIGNKLNSDIDKLNSYSNLQVMSIASNSRYSATCIDNYILFGIHYDNNFNQWTIKINRNTFNIEKIVQGYGFVGVDGALTGGEIPSELFSDYGFNDIVHPLSILKADIIECKSSIEQILQIDIGDKVVGTDSQQWYIYKKITGIVSHLTWNSETLDWDIVKLPLNNNVDQVYKSASFASRLLSNYIPYVNGLESMFPKAMMDSGSALATTIKITINTAFALAGAPLIYIIMPYLSLFNELQQTFGQYAYVHYNSTSIHQSKDMTTGNDDYVNNDKDDIRAAEVSSTQDSDSVVFNVHTVPQTAEHLEPFMDLITTVMQFGFGVADGIKKVKINEHTDITPDKETGNSVSTPYYIYNKDNLCASEMSTEGFTPATTSKVTGCLSLDMFYSTCDQQKISAGPGWVNHNMVAQCTAQSITSHSMYLQQVALKFVLGFLTEIQLDLIYDAEKAAYDALEDARSTYKDFQAWATSVGVVVATAAMAAKATLYVSMLMIEGCKRYMKDSILPALGDGKIEFIRPAKKETTTYDCERTHKYGSKTECFMWPCFDIPKGQKIIDEAVVADVTNKPWKLNVPLSNNTVIDSVLPPITIGFPTIDGITTNTPSEQLKNNWKGDCDYFIANAKGQHTEVELPNDMAYVIGVESFMPPVQYRNENIGESEPVFATPPFQDYVIDKNWQLGHTASVGMTTWVSCKDTKIIDGEYSNIVIDGLSFCGVACPYTAIEIKAGLNKKYLRPWAITPNALALNITGINCCYDEKAYHAFDGYGYRIVNWAGVPGMNKEHQTFMYNFLVNDRFKRSNKLPLNEFLGNFKSDPVIAIKGDANDRPFLLITQPGEGKGLTAGTIGEDKDVRRYAIPVFSEFVSTLPAVVKTISANSLSVIDGITSLTTENRDLQTAYKAPLSIDFAIGKNLYRFTNEYICSLSGQKGVTTTQDIVPCLGLEFIGATPYEAYLYSPATKQYYSYSGGSSLNAVDMIERFRDVINGRYDFINQEVVLPCLATFNRLDSNVYDDTDETDNVIVPRMKNNKFIGEIWPPLNTIFNTRSWFRTLSMPMGIVYQGPNRCIINRFVYSDYMLEQIKANYGLWQRVPKEKYNPFRKYKAVYESVDKSIGDYVQVKGWTHNPFLLVTAPLGVGEETDCIFEWEVTFCWPVEMDKLYGPKDYAVVNVQAETMTPGGKVIAARPTHIYLTKDLFTRTGNYGYYSFRYQSECGAGNRERLHIWSDQYICISGLQVEYKTMTSKRNEILTQHVDIQQLNEI